MLFADVNFTTEGIVVIGVLLSSLVGAVVFLFKMVVKDKDNQIEMARTEAKSYREIGSIAVRSLKIKVNESLEREGKPTITEMADVVPEHHSRTTDEQRRTAELATLRAELVAVQKAGQIDPDAVVDTPQRLAEDIKDKAVDLSEKLKEVAAITEPEKKP